MYLFDRFVGIDYLFDKCKDFSVLDIGCGDGLISFELARNGAKVVHGVDNNREEINFCTKLFKNEKRCIFIQLDLCTSYAIPTLNKRPFDDRYDIVLFMSIYSKCNADHMMNLMNLLVSKCNKYLVVRSTTTLPSNFKPKEFNLVHQVNNKYFGTTFIYKRITSINPVDHEQCK